MTGFRQLFRLCLPAVAAALLVCPPARAGDTINTYAGTGQGGYSGDGGPALSAKLDKPAGLFVTPNGDVYFADKNNFVVRKVEAATGLISTVAGGGAPSVGDGFAATSAWLNMPQTMALDAAGNLYIADTDNHRIRKVDVATGLISTIAGTGTQGYSGDGGQGASAMIRFPRGIAVDSVGNVIFADTDNHRIRMIDGAGIISTIAGTGTGGFNGDGGPATSAKIDKPGGVSIDGADAIYIADTNNHRIRKFTIGGTISTIAGKGDGFSGDGSSATNAKMSKPKGVWVVGNGVNTNSFGYDTISAFGYETIFASTQDNVKNKQIATQVTLIQDETITGITAYVGGNDKKVRYAVYTDSAGEPGALLAETGTVNTKNTRQWVSADLPPTLLTAGTYWLALSFENDNHEYTYASTGGQTRYSDRNAVSNGYSNTWGTSSTTNTQRISIYATTASTQKNVKKKQIATQVTLLTDGTVISMTAFVGGIDKKTRYAIYTDNAGEPDVLLAETDKVTTPKDPSGWLTINLPPTALTAGTYWLALAFEDDKHEYTYEASGGQTRYRNRDAVADGYTATWGSSDTTNTRKVYIYATTYTQTNEVYVADTGNHRIRKFLEFGTIDTIAGQGGAGYSGDGGPATNAKLNKPELVTVTSAGDVFIGDTKNHRVRKVDAATGIITTYGGTGTAGYSGDAGPATSAMMEEPRGVLIDGSGDLLLADSKNHVIRKIAAATGVITVVAGTPLQTFGIPDGILATDANLEKCEDVTLDTAGNLYIACSTVRRVLRVDAVTGIITNIIGTGTQIAPIDPTEDVMLLKPTGVAIDDAGNVYVADSDPLNSRIVKFTTAGATYATIAGTGVAGFSGDGGLATLAMLNEPHDLAVDQNDNIYIADTKNNRIRKIDAVTGLIDTVAGDGTAGYSGDGGSATSARLDRPRRVAADLMGHIYVADRDNHVIRKVYSHGVIVTIAGNGVGGFFGDGGPAERAQLQKPEGIGFVRSGTGFLYLSDTDNQRIRVVDRPINDTSKPLVIWEEIEP